MSAKLKQEQQLPEAGEYCQPYVSNYVSTAYISARFNNEFVATAFGRRANPRSGSFPCCSISAKEPRVSFQVFEPDKVVISGAKSREESLWGIWKFCALMTRVTGIRYFPRAFEPDNIVAFGGVGFPLDLHKFHAENQASFEPPAEFKGIKIESRKPLTNKRRKRMRGMTYAEYNPKRFRGLQYFPLYPVNINLFPTGKYVATGSRDEQHILKAINCVQWERFRLQSTESSYEKIKARIDSVIDQDPILGNALWRAYKQKARR